jgi:transposase
VARDNASTHEDDEVEDVERAAAGCPVLRYLPTYSPRPNPTETPWRHCRREVTHHELFEDVKALLAAAVDPSSATTESRTRRCRSSAPKLRKPPDCT